MARRRPTAPMVALMPFEMLPVRVEADLVEDTASPSPSDTAALPDRLLRSAEVAAILDLSQRTLRRLARSGALPAVKIGRTVRYRVSCLHKYLSR